MVTCSASFSVAKPSQTPPVKAKESLRSTSKKSNHKKANEWITVLAPPMMVMDLTNEEEFPKLPPASTSPAQPTIDPPANSTTSPSSLYPSSSPMSTSSTESDTMAQSPPSTPKNAWPMALSSQATPTCNNHTPTSTLSGSTLTCRSHPKAQLLQILLCSRGLKPTVTACGPS